jgi:ubiquinone/menaquinone biosynthesis C-methylase UbiE
LTAVDISAKSIEIAQKRMAHYGIKNISFIVDDAESLNKLPDNTYDIIFSFSTIRYCPNPHKALSAIYKKLRRGGIVIVDFPNKYSPWHFLLKSLFNIGKHVHDTLYSKSSSIRLFENAGFEIKDVKLFLFTTKRLPNALLLIFRSIDSILEKIYPFNRLAGIIMVKGIKN